jgi:hypothetical protein
MLSQLLSLLFFAGCAPDAAESANERLKSYTLSIVHQMILKEDAAMPLAACGGFVIADDAGNVTLFDSSYRQVWHVNHKGAEFACAGVAENDRLFIGSSDGGAFCLNLVDGSTVWTNSCDASFIHQPVLGHVGAKQVLWELSADDGRIFCFDAGNGQVMWESEDTNRSDGGMILWSNRLAYGNCDGAVHIFNAVDGKKIASVPVGDSDQMAGTPVVDKNGVLDLEQLRLISSLEISEEEAFTVPVRCGSNSVVFGIGEGAVLNCGLKGNRAVINRQVDTGAAVEFLLYDGTFINAVSGGNLVVYDGELKQVASLNIGDSIGGISMIGNHSFAVKADDALLFVKGEWK